MSVTHINLLQRAAPKLPVVRALVALLLLTLLGLAWYGSVVLGRASAATQRREVVAQQLKQVQAQLAQRSGEQAKSASALALRKEVDTLQPQALVAQQLLDALRKSDSGRTDDFARPLAALTGLAEPGLWLTTVTVSAGGKRLELQGEANTGAAVLRFAGRANQTLQPLTLRLDGLDLQPVTATAAAAGQGSAGALTFRLY